MGAGNEKKLPDKLLESIVPTINYEIIWIGPKVDEKFKTDVLKELNCDKIIFFQNTKDAIIEIEEIEFKDLYIIIYEKLCKEFIEKFKENIDDIYTIPKIILLLDNKKKFINENKEYINNNPFYFNFMATNLNEIQTIIINPQKEKNSQHFIFEYKDKKLFNMNKDISFFLQILENMYSNFNTLGHLINQIKYLDNIPLELLSKYFLRLYFVKSDFYKDMQMNLQQNKLLYYMPYITVLYEGLKLKSLPVTSHKVLYRSSEISNDELQLLLNKFNNQNENILTNKIVSKQFLIFSGREEEAYYYLKKIVKKKK